MLKNNVVRYALKVMSLLIIVMGTTIASVNAKNHHVDFIKAFQYSYQNPASVPAAIKYAEAAVKIGDYEAAIPPLERVLMFNPDLNEVRLEVGVLYYLLNSKDMARKHLSIVERDSDADRDVKLRAASYLAKL